MGVGPPYQDPHLVHESLCNVRGRASEALPGGLTAHCESAARALHVEAHGTARDGFRVYSCTSHLNPPKTRPVAQQCWTAQQLCVVLQMPEIFVHIVPAVEGLTQVHIEPHERNAKRIVDTLRRTYGNGNLLDPMRMCVIPNPQRFLGAGIYTFKRNPEGELRRDQMLRLDIRECL